MAKKKKITNVFKLVAPGGQATPAPPIGPVLGAKGVNPGQFVQRFNEATRELNGKVVGCVVTVYEDRSFDIEIKSSPVSVMIKDKVGLQKGSGEAGSGAAVGTLSEQQVREIAEEKFKDLNAGSIEAAMRVVEGTARSMGVKVARG